MTARPKEPPRRMTADEFFAWAADQPGKRYELDDGEVVAMSPERLAHTRVKRLVTRAFEQGIEALRLPCEPIADGVSVRISETVVYGPDAVVRCGTPAAGNVIEIDDPTIVVEVVSPSSHSIDTGKKLLAYFELTSVRHYLIVQTSPSAVIHHERDAEGNISTRIHRNGELRLDPPGFTVDIADFFPPA